MSDIVYRLQALTPATEDMISTVAAETIEEACGEILKLRGLLTEARRERDEARAEMAAIGRHAKRIEDVERKLQMSEARYATLKEAYDRERRRPIQIVGSEGSIP